MAVRGWRAECKEGWKAVRAREEKLQALAMKRPPQSLELRVLGTPGSGVIMLAEEKGC